MFKKASVKWIMKIYKTKIVLHLNALRAGVQACNQFSLRIGYKVINGEIDEKPAISP